MNKSEESRSLGLPLAGVLAVLTLAGLGCGGEGQGGPRHAETLRQLSIFEAPGEYCAWPDLVRTAGGDLIVLFCKSEEHLGPDGAILLSRSTDNGTNWLAPEVVFDTPIDDRESGITVLSDGRLLAHFVSTFHSPEKYAALRPLAYEQPVLTRWTEFVQRPEYRRAEALAGSYNALSTDGGRTWSAAVPGRDAVHGGIQLDDGTLLVASYRETLDSITVNVANRPLVPWTTIATVSSPRPDSLRFGEPHVLQLPSGRILMMIRATTKPYNDGDERCHLWETFSDDRGRTWADPIETPLWGFPPHLLLLSDGRVLVTYGYRREPFGQRACISEDGLNWDRSQEIIIRDDAPNKDLGYPASIELEPGKVLTVYYQPDVPPGTVQQMNPPDSTRTKPGILGTVWTVPESHP